jgi:arabinogalactan oligomer/maltooligosaccharide transport system substrate-binding protein
MKKSIRTIIAGLLSTAVLGTMFMGCGKKDDPNEITIWSQYQNEDLKIVQDMANDWAKQSGHKVKVVEDKGGYDSLVTAAKGGKAPDVLIGVANDHLGAHVKGGLLDEVKSGVMDESDYIDAALEASAIDGKRYGLPLTLETYVLFYNKDLVKTVPKTWDEMIEQAKTVGFNYCLNDFYYSLALIQGNGGYVFKSKDGKIDTNDIGLNNPGAIKGFEMINSLATSNMISASVTGDIAKGNFQNGKIGFYLSGPWDVNAFKSANVNFGVAPFPQINGAPTPTVCGVKLALVPSSSKKKDLAWDFMGYLAKSGPYKLFKQTAAIPVLKSEQQKDEIKNDPITSVFAEQSKHATPMSCAPEFGQVWEPAKQNITAMVTGEQNPKDTADNIVKQMKEKITAMK